MWWMKRSPCKVDALSSGIDLRRGTGTRLSTSARLATNQHDKECGKEEVVVVLERVWLGIRAAGWRLKGCVASEICHPDVNQYFVGFVRAPPSTNLLLSLSYPRVPPVRILVYAISLVCTRQLARQNLQDRVCDRRQCTNDKRTTNPSSRWLIF